MSTSDGFPSTESQQKYTTAIAQQQKYFSTKATINHRAANFCNISSLVLTTVLSVVAAFNIKGESIALGAATTGLGGVVAIIQGVNKICNFDRVGDRSRITSEKLKTMQRGYNAGMLDFKQFFTQTENIIRLDVQQFEEESEDEKADK